MRQDQREKSPPLPPQICRAKSPQAKKVDATDPTVCRTPLGEIHVGHAHIFSLGQRLPFWTTSSCRIRWWPCQCMPHLDSSISDLSCQTFLDAISPGAVLLCCRPRRTVKHLDATGLSQIKKLFLRGSALQENGSAQPLVFSASRVAAQPASPEQPRPKAGSLPGAACADVASPIRLPFA